MKQSIKFWIASGIALCTLATTSLTRAEIVPDATLPNNSSVTTSGNTSIITGGTRAGSNLFHSFEEFSVPAKSAAYFKNALDIQNIISRVTGSSASNINGKLRANGAANVFLLNPNGIIFGSDATLAIGGSLLASTASAINFADGIQFSATAPTTTPVLTVSVPIGLQFGGNAGGIRVQSSGLSVRPGETLALVGGNITLEGGELAASGEPNLAAKGGRIELGSVAEVGEVSLNQRGNSWVLGYDRVDAFRDIKLEDGAFVDASGSGGGDIQIQGDQLDLTQESSIYADTEGTEAGSEVLVHTTGATTLSDGSLIVADVYGSGTGGDLTIETGQLRVQGNGSLVSAVNYGQGKGGNLTVSASDSVELLGRGSGLFTESRDTGDAGNLMIQTGRLVVQDGARVRSATLGAGLAGTLTVEARDSVKLIGKSADGQLSSGLFTQVFPGAMGAGGNLTIETGRLTVRDGAQIGTGTFGKGRSGNLVVRALELVELIGTSENNSLNGLFTTVESAEATGAGGNLTIETGRLTVRDGSQVQTATSGAGSAGNLVVSARDAVELIGTLENGDPSSLLTSVQPGATGTGGNLTIETGRLTVRDGAQVQAATFGAGSGGILTINASDSVELSGAILTATPFRGSSGSFVSAERGSTGNVGDLRITTGQLIVQNGAKISADNFGTDQGGTATLNVRQLIVQNGGLVRSGSFGEGPGGTLTVNASETVQVSGTGTIGPDKVNSTLFTQAEASGDAGNLNITTESLNVRDEADITVSSTGSGKAGELTVQAGSIEVDNNGSLRATTSSGNGGDITLQLQDLLLLRRNSQISSTAGTAQSEGNGGNITIDTPFIVAAKSENSDITANAFEGLGGFIQITAQQVFGLERREQLTRLSDITAFSQQNPELNGVVEINTPDVDPSRGLVNLPAEVVDASRLIASGCGAPQRQGQSEFIVTGRGGLPSSPSDTLSSDTVWSDLRPQTGQPQNRTISEQATEQTLPTAEQLVEAQGWVINNNGEVVLTASAPTVTPHSSRLTATVCHGS